MKLQKIVKPMTRKTAIFILAAQIISATGILTFVFTTNQSHILTSMTPFFIVCITAWPHIVKALRQPRDKDRPLSA
jgi:hypothetical protein